VRLLLLEDEADLGALLSRYLAKYGVDVTHVTDGQSGIDAFVAAQKMGKPFDVVLTDGLMPRKSGMEVCAAIRNLPGGRDVGVVLFSAVFRGARAHKDALEAGFNAYYAKPFVLADLRDGLFRLAKREPPTSSARQETTTTSPSQDRSITPQGASRLVVPPKLAVTGVPSTASALLHASRARFDGVLRLQTEALTASVAMIGGVVVGVTDDVPEHALGTWLRSHGRLSEQQHVALNARLVEKNERVAEALLALGFVSGAEALSMMEAQAKTRLRRLLALHGELSTVVGVEAARQIAVAPIDLAESILAAVLDGDALYGAAAQAFVGRHAALPIRRTIDFDSGLVAFARLRPISTLPMKLLEPSSTLGVGGTSVNDALEVYALWVAGLVTTDGEAPLIGIPRPVLQATVGRVVDAAAVDGVVAHVLRARGATYYHLVGLPQTASTSDVRARLQQLQQRWGRAALRDHVLGPATGAARELWAVLDEGLFIFADDRRRATYDRELTDLG